jgi:vacuolar-type H+-ATPase subunit I/STV1
MTHQDKENQMEEKHLVVAENLNPAKLFSDDGALIGGILEGIRKKLDDFEPDVSTEAGRKEIAAMAYKVSRSKTFLDDIRKEKIKKAKAEIDHANGIWKPAKTTLDEWRDETRNPLDEFEAEQARIKAEEERKEQERIQARVDELAKFDCQMPFFELAGLSDDEYAHTLSGAITDWLRTNALRPSALKRKQRKTGLRWKGKNKQELLMNWLKKKRL